MTKEEEGTNIRTFNVLHSLYLCLQKSAVYVGHLFNIINAKRQRARGGEGANHINGHALTYTQTHTHTQAQAHTQTYTFISNFLP